jgi:hypothetical protein
MHKISSRPEAGRSDALAHVHSHIIMVLLATQKVYFKAIEHR